MQPVTCNVQLMLRATRGLGLWTWDYPSDPDPDTDPDTDSDTDPDVERGTCNLELPRPSGGGLRVVIL